VKNERKKIQNTAEIYVYIIYIHEFGVVVTDKNNLKSSGECIEHAISIIKIKPNNAQM